MTSSSDEFGAIARWLHGIGPSAAHVSVPNGDDAATLVPRAGHEVVVCTDTLVSGVHFRPEDSASDIAWKAAAVNLSDLAAMGSEPSALLLALTVPAIDPAWMDGLRAGMSEITEAFQCPLVGGDLTRGPLSLTVTALGYVPTGRAIRRGGARDGDLLAVSGTIGDAALALAHPDGVPEALQQRLRRPAPRVALGVALRGVANALIDVSDGLCADAGHLAAASGLAVQIDAISVPTGDAFNSHCPRGERDALCLDGGDDYELCAAIDPAVWARSPAIRAAMTPIGHFHAGDGVHVVDARGAIMQRKGGGYRHF